MLIGVCRLQGLAERASLLERFLGDPGIVKSLVEADPELCRARLRRLVPFLEESGWRMDGAMIRSPQRAMAFHATDYDGDLDVLYRETLRDLQRSPGECPGRHSLVAALEALFQSERE